MSQQRRHSSRWLKVVIVLLALVALVEISFRLIFPSVIESQLAKAGIKTKYVDASLLFSRITINDVSFLKEEQNVQVKKILLNGISFFSYLFSKKIYLSELRLEEGVITILIQKREDGKKTGSDLNKLFRELKIEKIVFSNCKVNILGKDNSSISSTIDLLQLSNLTIQSQNNLKYDLKSISLEAKNIIASSADSLYRFQLKQISLSDEKLSMNNVVVIPTLDKKEFAIKKKRECDRFDCTIAKVEMNVDQSKFFNNEILTGNFLKISSLNLQVYHDKNFARVEKPTPMLQDAIKSLPVKLKLDSVLLSDAYIKYEERAPGSPTAGYVIFDSLNAIISNVSNITGDTIFVNAESRFMSHGKLNAEFQFCMSDSMNTFFYQAILKQFDLVNINSITNPNANLFINHGYLSEMNCNVKADKYSARGKMHVAYDDVDISMVDEQKKDTTGFMNQVLSFVVNTLIIDDKKKEGQKIVQRNAEIAYSRNPNRFLFNYAWKSLFSGLKEGITILDNKSAQKKSKNKKAKI